jgi:hypothetical protein
MSVCDLLPKFQDPLPAAVLPGPWAARRQCGSLRSLSGLGIRDRAEPDECRAYLYESQVLRPPDSNPLRLIPFIHKLL